MTNSWTVLLDEVLYPDLCSTELTFFQLPTTSTFQPLFIYAVRFIDAALG